MWSPCSALLRRRCGHWRVNRWASFTSMTTSDVRLATMGHHGMGGRCESCPFDTLIIIARGLVVYLTHHRALPPDQDHAIRSGSAAADRPHSKIMLGFDGGSTPTFKTPMSTWPSRAAVGLSSTSLSDHSHTSIDMTHPESTAPSPATPMNSTPSPPHARRPLPNQRATHGLTNFDSGSSTAYSRRSRHW